MLSNFTIRNNKIVLKNDGEYFGALKDFDKLKDYYTQLIDLVCISKECNFQ